MHRLIAAVALIAALVTPASAMASTWHYRKMNRGARISFMHDMSKPNHVITTKSRVCPKDRGVVAVSGRLEYGLYFTDCPLGYFRGKPEYQGANILARKLRPGAWKPLTAGTSWLYPGHYYGVPKHVLMTLVRMLGHDCV
jgi:hypothetical protein